MSTESKGSDPASNSLPGVVPSVLLVALLCTMAVATVEVLAATTGYSFKYFTNDPAATTGTLPLIGVLSHLGVLTMWGAAAACAFAAAVVARSRGWRHAYPLLVVAAATAYLAVDDLFMLHEWAYKRKLGIPEEPVYVVYGVAVLALGYRYREVFRRHEWQLVALAVFVLGASLAFDVFGEPNPDGVVRRFEDGLKLFGWAILALYIVRLGARMVAEAYPLPDADPTEVARSRTAAPTGDG